MSGGTPLITDLATVRFPAAHSRESGADRKEEAARRLMATFADADAVVAASRVDASFLQRSGSGRPTVTFEGLGDGSAENPPALDGGLLFIGDLLHHPNLQAVEWWMEEIAALVQARAGSPIPLRVVGRGSEAYRRLWDRPDRASVAGWKPDLSREHAVARLLVVPLPYATGTGGRIASALAHGLPVVASAAAAAVLSPSLATLVAAGDNAGQMADHIHRLMTDDDAWLEQRRLIETADLAALRASRAAALTDWLEVVTAGDWPGAGGRSNRRSGSRRAPRRQRRAS
ncbi:MAG: glycosyltransferase family 4 protein, partial [Acidimicrobiia bacterium]